MSRPSVLLVCSALSVACICSQIALAQGPLEDVVIQGGGAPAGSLEERFDREADSSLPREWRMLLNEAGSPEEGVVVAGNCFHRPNCASIVDKDGLRVLPGPVAGLSLHYQPCYHCFPEAAQACATGAAGHNLRLSENRVRAAYQGCLRALSRAVRYNMGSEVELDRSIKRIMEGDYFATRGAYERSRGASWDVYQGWVERQEQSYALAAFSAGRSEALHEAAGQARDEFKDAFTDWLIISEAENARLRRLLFPPM